MTTLFVTPHRSIGITIRDLPGLSCVISPDDAPKVQVEDALNQLICDFTALVRPMLEEYCDE